MTDSNRITDAASRAIRMRIQREHEKRYPGYEVNVGLKRTPNADGTIEALVTHARFYDPAEDRA
jgi:hypothetical protein